MQVNEKLKALRSRAGLSVRKMAEALEMAPSTYQHYEDKYKKEHLDPSLVEQLIPIFASRGIAEEEVRQLGFVQPGFAEGRAPQIDMSHIPPASNGQGLVSESVKNTENNPLNMVRMAIVGDKVQVAGTYDRDGIDKLISRLEKAKAMLDDG